MWSRVLAYQIISNQRAKVFNSLSTWLRALLDSVAPCGATLSNKIHGFFLYVTHLLIFSKREDDNGLNRQLGKLRIVYGVRSIFFGGGGGGNSVV